MKNRILNLCGGAALLALAAGCAAPTKYVDPDSSRTVLSVGKINMQDWNQAANTMIDSLVNNVINKDKLQSADGPDKPSILAISRIVNNTGQQIDTDMLVKRIRIALNQTGKVLTSTTMGLDNAEDPLARETQQERERLGQQKPGRRPDYTLSGKIIEDRDNAGSIRQTTYFFQLSLTSKDGLAIWEDEKRITKQGNKGSVGY